MTNEAISPANSPSPSPLVPKVNFFQRIIGEGNPVLVKELRSVMRGKRAFVTITLYLIILGSLVGGIYAITAASDSVTMSATTAQTIGQAVFAAVVGMEFMMVCFVAPAFSAGAIAAERERQTYDLLRTTLLSPRSLVQGKMTAGVLFLIILLVVGFPLRSLAFYLGGISLSEVAISFLMLVVTAIVFSAIGILASSLVRTTLLSTVVSYIIAVILVFGVPLLVLLLIFASELLSSSFYNLTTYQETLLEIILLAVGYILVCTNPLAAAFTSELILVENQSLLSINLPLTNGWQVFLISPWIIFIFIYTALSWTIIQLCIRRVGQVER